MRDAEQLVDRAALPSGAVRLSAKPASGVAEGDRAVRLVLEWDGTVTGWDTLEVVYGVLAASDARLA